MRSRISILSATLVVESGCHDGPTDPSRPLAADGVRGTALNASANDAFTTSTVRWNRMSIALFRARGNPNAGRTSAYLSLAQYRAVLAAQDARHGKSRPSLAGAAAGASVVVLNAFFPLDAAAIDAALAAQRAEPPLGTEINTDFAEGEAIGREVAAAVLAWAASDNFGLTSPGVPPVGPGYWVSSGTPIVRGGLGARPFFLTSGSRAASAAAAAAGVRVRRVSRRTRRGASNLRRSSHGRAVGDRPEVGAVRGARPEWHRDRPARQVPSIGARVGTHPARARASRTGVAPFTSNSRHA